MSVTSGEILAETLDKGINLVSVLPEDHITAIGASYRGGINVLFLEQSPYLESEEAGNARLRILGAVAGMPIYGDESMPMFILANNARLPDGTLMQLSEPRTGRSQQNSFRLAPEVLESSYVVGDFLRSVNWDLRAADLEFDAHNGTTIHAAIRGSFTSDEMKESYLRTVKNETIVEEALAPTSMETVARMTHTVLMSATRQVITFSMYDHRPGVRDEMLRLKRDQA